MGSKQYINTGFGIALFCIVLITLGFGFGIKAPQMNWYKQLTRSTKTQERHTVISAEGFNLLYIGLENPISIASSGFPPEDLLVSVSDGTIKRVGNSYLVKVWKPGIVYLSVNGRVGDGSIVKLARKKFRVRRLPKPLAMWGSISIGGNPKVAYLAQIKVRASMGAGFAYDRVKYHIIEYDFTYAKKDSIQKDSFDVSIIHQQGDIISPQMKKHIQNGNPGDRFWIDKIKAVWEKDTIKLQPSMYYVTPITW